MRAPPCPKANTSGNLTSLWAVSALSQSTALPKPSVVCCAHTSSHNPAVTGVWRNGSASDSRSEGWEFESLCPQYSFGAPNHGIARIPRWERMLPAVLGMRGSTGLLPPCLPKAQRTPNCLGQKSAEAVQQLPLRAWHSRSLHSGSTSSSG